MDTAIRAAICDDSLGYPMLVRAWLDADGRFEVVGTAATGAAIKELVAAERPDVVVLDVVLPDVDDTAQLVESLRERHAAVRIVLASSLPEDKLAGVAERAQVQGWVGKSAGPEATCAAVARAAAA